MKKLLYSIVLIFIFSCDDGDLQIETIDFDSITTINYCDEIEIDQENILFKINENEALILELPANLLINEISTEDIESIISSDGPSTLTYRTFSDDVSTDYFCSDIPLTTPTVTEEIVASSGLLYITTTTEDNVTYDHDITLSNITFETSANTRITDLNIESFGDISTEKSSVSIDFNDITTINNCDSIETDQENVVFKIKGSEALILKLPANLLTNAVTTTDTESTISIDGETTLTYRFYTNTVSTDYFCSSVTPATPEIIEEFSAESGTVLITTTTEDNINYTHTITLDSVVFESSIVSQIINVSIDAFGDISTTAN